jgi:hypothetical protein
MSKRRAPTSVEPSPVRVPACGPVLITGGSGGLNTSPPLAPDPRVRVNRIARRCGLGAASLPGRKILAEARSSVQM